MTDSPFRRPTLDEFEAVLRRHDSATLALEEWCARQGIGAHPAHITASLINTAQNELAEQASVRSQLRLEAHETAVLRHVRLRCGDAVLSVAWNWYVPSRLPPQMNAQLLASDIPFGKVIASLKFIRQPLETHHGPVEMCAETIVSTHRAMLVLPDGQPLAYLIECYTSANLESGR